MKFFLISCMLILGLLLIYYDLFVKVSYKVKCSIAETKGYSAKNIITNLTESLSDFLKPKIKLSDEQSNNLKMILRTATRNINEKDYISKLLAQSILIFIFLSIVCLPLIINNIGLYICLTVGFSIAYFYYCYNKEKQTYMEYKRKIEDDLPKFCSVISSQLQSTSIVTDILKAFLPIANKQMASEIEKTLMDINISSVEDGLLRFENRIQSSKLSEIIRGLISVARGNEQILYFGVKQAQFNDDYKLYRRQEIKRRTFKLVPAFAVLGIIFIIAIFYPLAKSLMDSNLFNL